MILEITLRLFKIFFLFLLIYFFYVYRVLENVTELWTEIPPGGKKGKAINRDRVISKMFLRGKNILVFIYDGSEYGQWN